MKPHRPLLLSILAAAALGAGAAPTQAATPPTASGWIVVRDALDPSYTPAARDRGNSTGAANSVTRLSEGRYEVRMPGLPGDGSTVMVTPLGSRLRYCHVDQWGFNGGAARIVVQCTSAEGGPADTQFALTYTAATGVAPAARRLGYFWLDKALNDITPDTDYQYTSRDTTIEVEHVSDGRYRATLPGLGGAGGHVQVSSYGSPSNCRVRGWTSLGDDALVDVVCRRIDGALKDARFDLLYLHRVGPEGFGGTPFAYVRATKAGVAKYRPAEGQRFHSKGKDILVTRSGPGRYSVLLAGMPGGGAAVVTGAGKGNAHCQVRSIRVKSPQRVRVDCYGPDGLYKDSPFTLAWTK